MKPWGPSSASRRFWPKRVVLVFVSILVALLVAEIGLRIHHHVRWRAALDKHLGDDGLPITIASDVPGLVYTYRSDGDGMNSQGYFDEEHSWEKPPGVFRIVVIGDSLAAGQFVDRQESFPKLIEQRLNESPIDRRCEVIVLARSGYSTSQELVLLRDEAFQYQPDLILWSYVLNDPAHPLVHAVSGDLQLLYRPSLHVAHLAWKGWFLLREMINARGGPTEYHERLHYVYWQQVERDFDEIGRLCREHEVPVVLVIHPVFDRERPFEQYALVDLHAALKDLAVRSDLVPLDVLPAYRPFPPERLSFKDDPWHPNALGHRLAADYLFDRLIERGLLPKAVDP
jgi:lysophospholipase L1-like esterase